MPKKLTLDEWIARARCVHGNTYDYRCVVYKGKESKVTIICSIHGEFKQIANNHVRGKGCPRCAKNARLTQKTFIEQAKQVHGEVYDYSETKFTRTCDKVSIICAKHGLFEQEANSHLRGSGCPQCANVDRSIAVANHPYRADNIKNTVLKRYGVENVMHVVAFKRRLIDTNLEKYGVENYTQTDEYDAKRIETSLSKYNVEHYSQTDMFKAKLQDIMYTRHGVSNYAQSDEYKSRLPGIIEKSRQTQLNKYGAKHYAKSEAFRKVMPDMLEKGYRTKVKNKSFRVSNAEMRLEGLLKDLFGADDVLTQRKDVRYPFACDFYIPSRDLFIELNATWTHGGHWFDPNDIDDIARLDIWYDKSIDSAYYENAIETWTTRDVRKRTVAKDNGLNYIVFWDNLLIDFKRWVDKGCPDGRDYDKEYSWLQP